MGFYFILLAVISYFGIGILLGKHLKFNHVIYFLKYYVTRETQGWFEILDFICLWVLYFFIHVVFINGCIPDHVIFYML